MSIQTRLRAIERQRQKKSAGLSYVTDNGDGTYSYAGVRYEKLSAIRRIVGNRPGHILYISRTPEPDPVPPEFAPRRPRRGPSS